MGKKLKIFQDDIVEKQLSKYKVEEPEKTVGEQEPEKTIVVPAQHTIEFSVSDDTVSGQNTYMIDPVDTDTVEQIEQEDEDDDDEYEYVTPHYLRNAVLIALIFMLAGMLTSYFMMKDSIADKLKNGYIAQGYMMTNDATATAKDIRLGKTAYVHGRKIVGEYTDLDTGNATATPADILEGYSAYVNGVKIVGAIKTYSGDTTIVPTTKDIVIKAGTYLKGQLIIQGDGNLQPQNIVKGVTIFGVSGTYTGN